MPQAPAYLRNKIKGYFGNTLDMTAPLEFLKDNGWSEPAFGVLAAPHRTISKKEWDCCDFLICEWDFAYSGMTGKTETA